MKNKNFLKLECQVLRVPPMADQLFFERRLIFLADSAPEGAGEKPEVKKEEPELYETTDTGKILKLKHSLRYNQAVPLKRNIEDIVKAALGNLYREGYMQRVNTSVERHISRAGAPDTKDVERMELQDGQILFLDDDNDEVTRIDVSSAFYEVEAPLWVRTRARERELRATQRARSGLSDRIAASRGSKGGRPSWALDVRAGILAGMPAPRMPATPPPRPIDPLQRRAAERVLWSLRGKEHEKGSILDAVERDFNIAFPLDKSIGDMDYWSFIPFNDDNEWQERWNQTSGHDAVDALINEKPQQTAAPGYETYKKANDAFLKTVPYVYKQLTDNFENDYIKFKEWVELIRKAEGAPAIQRSIGDRWKYREAITAVYDLLETHKKGSETQTYRINPFQEHHLGVDAVRRIIQIDMNDHIEFEEVAEVLYSEHLEEVKAVFKRHGVPDALIKFLTNDPEAFQIPIAGPVLRAVTNPSLERVYKNLKKLADRVKLINQEKDPEKRKKLKKTLKAELGLSKWKEVEKAIVASELIGDYVAYSVRLMNLIRQLEYKPDRELSAAALTREGGDIYKLEGSNNDVMRLAKTGLLKVFFNNVSKPERYFTLNEHMWGWLGNQDNEERAITMRDFNDGRTYSVDKTWFLGITTSGDTPAKYLSAETMYKMVYEAGIGGGTLVPQEQEINMPIVTERLKRQLSIGLSAYSAKPDSQLSEIMERNHTVYTGRLDKDLQTLYAALGKELDAFLGKTDENLKKWAEKLNKLNGINNDLETKNSDKTTAEQKITELEGEIESVEDKLEDQEEKREDAVDEKKDAGAFNTEISRLKTKKITLQRELTNQQKALVDAEKEIKKLEGEKETAQDNIDELKEELDEIEISEDLQNFIRLGAVIDYHNGGAAETRLEKGKKDKYHVMFDERQVNALIEHLRSLKRFDETQLGQIRENFLAGIVVGYIEGEGVAGGIGTTLALPGGAFIDVAAFGKENLAGGYAGVGKTFQFEKVALTPRFGASAVNGPGGTRFGGLGGELGAGYTFEGGVKAGVAAGYSTLGWHVGASVDWSRTQERYEAELDRTKIEHHINTLRVLPPAQRYQEIQAHPEKYPELYQAIYAVESLPGNVEYGSRVEVMDEIFRLYGDVLADQALHDAFPIVRGAILRVVMVKGFLPVPVIGIDFGIAHRDLVLRFADYEHAEGYTQAALQQEILKGYADSKKVRISDKIIQTSGKIMVDEKGNLGVSRAANAAVDLAAIDPYSRFESAFEKATDIELTPMGSLREDVMRLDVRRAYGEIRVYIDPDLKDNAMVITNGNELYLSVDRKQKIYVTREDITYPFPNEGATERTFITISNNPYLSRASEGGITENSTNYISKRRGFQWRISKNTFREPRPGEKETQQANVLDWNKYHDWRRDANNKDKIDNRLSGKYIQDYESAYKELVEAFTVSVAEDAKVRGNLGKLAQELADNPAVMQEYRKLSTEGLKFVRGAKIIDSAHYMEKRFELVELFQKAITALGETEKLNPLEINALLFDIMLRSISDIQGQNDAYRAHLEYFELPMLTAVFTEYYKDVKPDDARERKIKSAVDFVMANAYPINLYMPTVDLAPGAYFGTHAGSGNEGEKIVGIRRFRNWDENDPYGMIRMPNITVESLSKDSTAGDIARMWINSLTGFPDIKDSAAFDKLFEKNPDTGFQRMIETLRSPLALKLIPIFGQALVLTPQEMEHITEIVKTNQVVEKADTYKAAAVKKALLFCHQVRQAQLAGKKEFEIPNSDFKINIKFDVIVGIYKKCGNISGAVQEDFELIYKPTNQVVASSAYGYVGTKVTHGRYDITGLLGTGVAVKERPFGARDGEEPPPEEEKKGPYAPIISGR